MDKTREHYKKKLRNFFTIPKQSSINLIQFTKFAQENLETINNIMENKNEYFNCQIILEKYLNIDKLRKVSDGDFKKITQTIIDVTIEVIIDAIYERSNKENQWTHEYEIKENDIVEQLFIERWYRGQTNYEWNLIPTFLRPINTKAPNVVLVNHKYIYEDYLSNSIVDRINKILEPKITTQGDLKYDKISYIQHSLSYSPLLDFTNSFPIALSFALGNTGNPYEYNNIDSAVFELEMTEIKNNILKTEKDIDDFI